MQNTYYTIKFVNAEDVRFVQQVPSVSISKRRILDDGTGNIEHHDVLLDTVIFEQHLVLDHPLFRRGNTNALMAEATERTIENFALFLTNISRTRIVDTWDNFAQILDSQVRSYYLLSSRRQYFGLRAEIPNWGEEITFHDCHIKLEWISQIMSDDCYIIIPEQYTVYIYLHRHHTIARVYISPFIDMERRNFIPIRLDANNVLALLRGELYTPREQTPPLLPLLDTEKYALVKSSCRPIAKKKHHEKKLHRCPVCSGRIKYLSEADAFCLDCDWDNLLPLGV